MIEQPGESQKLDEITALLQTGEAPEPPPEVETPPEPTPEVETPTPDAAAEPAPKTPPETEGEPEKAKPSSLAELAESAGISVTDIFAVQVPLGDELGSLSLGTLKDKAQRVESLDQDREQLRNDRGSLAAERLTLEQHLDTVKRWNGQQLTAEQMGQLEGIQADNTAANRRALLAARPDWADAPVYEAAEQRISALLDRWHFPAGAVKMLHTWQLANMLAHFADIEAEAAKLADPKPKKAKGQRPSRRADVERKKPAPVPKSDSERVGAIADLLANPDG